MAAGAGTGHPSEISTFEPNRETRPMRGATGAKTRRLAAREFDSLRSFHFNKSIHPRGGTLSRARFRSGKKYTIVKLFQDLNNDGKISRKELIYRGRSRSAFTTDELTNFSGTLRLKKTMHRCSWMAMKFPGEPLICTQEYIPDTYRFSVVVPGQERRSFEGLGDYADPMLFAFTD